MIKGSQVERTCPNCGLRTTHMPVSEWKCPACGYEKTMESYAQSQMGSLELRYSERKGLGVWTTEPIRIAELVEAAPVLVWLDSEIKIDGLRSNAIEIAPSKNKREYLAHYLLPWMTRGVVGGPRAFVLGYGMVYNHSKNPNAAWTYRTDDNGRYWMDFYATRDIEAGCEVTVSYGDRVWFTPYD